jgi:CheY-like chemotaxis protein
MLNILLIEDSEDDAFLLEKALNREGINCSLRRVENGVQAVSYLEGEGNHADRNISPFPDVVFTDLNMPVMDGFEVLHWLKTHPKRSVLPVMVFSASADAGDIDRAYRLGANAYLVKPSSMVELQASVVVAHEFWKRCAKAAALGTGNGGAWERSSAN